VPGCPDTSEPVVVLSFGVVGLVEKTIVGCIFTTCDSTAFHFPVPIAQIGVRVYFATYDDPNLLVKYADRILHVQLL
jgi:hypothetical protein